MKKICKMLCEDVNFLSERIVPCYSNFWNNCPNIDSFFIKVDKDDTQGVDFDYYLRQRDKYIQMYLDNEEPEFCENCDCYIPLECEETDNNEESCKNSKFKKLYIYNNQPQCPCKCLYCSMPNNERHDSQQIYNVSDIINKIENNDLIDENTEISLFDGGVGEYSEQLNAIIDCGLRHNCSFEILSNAVSYNEKIAEILKNKKITLRIQFDCGTKETYTKIKKVDNFDSVIANLKKYSEDVKDNLDGMIQLKYIICPGYNDSIKEIKAFFAIAESLGVKNVILSINKTWLSENFRKSSKNTVKQILRYWKDEANYPEINKVIDYNELWQWWVEKLLAEKSFFDIFKK